MVPLPRESLNFEMKLSWNIKLRELNEKLLQLFQFVNVLYVADIVVT